MPYEPPHNPAQTPKIHAKRSSANEKRFELRSEYPENKMRTPAKIPLIIPSGAILRIKIPAGRPKRVEIIKRLAPRNWIWRQSKITETAATIIEANTAMGAAACMGKNSANNGTEIKASPKPKVVRNVVAIKIMAEISATRGVNIFKALDESDPVFFSKLTVCLRKRYSFCYSPIGMV